MRDQKLWQLLPLRYMALMLAAGISGAFFRALGLHLLPTLVYFAILFVWLMMLHRRVLDRRIRVRLECAAVMMILLFVLRTCRYELFCNIPDIERYLWYLYYLPFTSVPMITLFAALHIGKEVRFSRALERTLLFLWLLLCAAILTNDLHGAMFRPTDGLIDPDAHSLGPLYYFTIGWIVALTLAMFFLLIYRSSLIESRKRWSLPVLTAAAFILLLLFTAFFGSPKLFGFTFLIFQEIFCFLYITLLEVYIELGLIPSNTDYDELLRCSPFPVEIKDRNDETVFASECDPPDEEDAVQRRAPISGGCVVWTEDLSGIHRKNQQLEEAVEVIESENILIEQENAVRAEQKKYEMLNRLYDKIALSVRPQVLALEQLLSEDLPEDESTARLRYATVLGAYIKRYANLMLLSHENSRLSVGELLLCVRESMEYLSLSDVTCAAVCDEDALLPASVLQLAYALFEDVIEAAYDGLTACEVRIKTAGGFRFGVSTDCPPPELDGRIMQELRAQGAELEIKTEDDTTTVTLLTGQEVTA